MKLLIKLLILTGCLSTLHKDIKSQSSLSDKKTALSAIVEGVVNTGNNPDTIILDLLDDYVGNANFLKVIQSDTQIITKGHFKFKLAPISGRVYITVRMPHQNRIYRDIMEELGRLEIKQNFIEPGDSIYVRFKPNNAQFSGKGAARFQCMYNIMKEEKLKVNGLPRVTFVRNQADWTQLFANMDTLLEYKLKVLDLSKGKLSKREYEILKADIFGEGESAKFFTSYIGFKSADSSSKKWLLNYYLDKFYNKPVDMSFSSELKESPFFAAYLVRKIKIDHKFRIEVGLETEKSIYSIIKKEYGYGGSLNDMVIATYFFQEANYIQMDSMLLGALSYVKTPKYRNKLIGLADTFGKGKQVMNFSLVDSMNKLVRLADFKGKVVIIDFWFTGCGACKILAKELAKVELLLKNNPEVVFISLSIDIAKEKWLQSIRKDASPSKAYPHAGKHFSTDRSVYLYTNGNGKSDPFIKKYVQSGGYPKMLLIDKKGNIISANPSLPWPNTKRGEELADMIVEALKGN